MEQSDIVSERAWLAALAAAVGALVVGSVALPRLVYRGFVWKYFWGPVYSDAHNGRCAVLRDGGIEILDTNAACAAASDTGAVAYTGYTLVSEAGYMVTLVFMLAGVLLLLKRLAVAEDRGLFFALVPFMLFGGAFRVIEDAYDTVPASVDTAITYPLNTLIISPVIYFTVFVITLGALLAGIALERRGAVDNYYTALGAIGVGVLGATLAFLFYSAFTYRYISLYPQILLLDVIGATVLAYVVWRAADAYDPAINAGTGRIGLVVIWGHAIDGVANVIAADWVTKLTPLETPYSAKHPVNQIIIDLTETIQPAGLSALVGTSWPFLVVKLVVAVGIVWLFDERIMEESPRYALLLLIAAVAVGLGPGTRDILRVTFAI